MRSFAVGQYVELYPTIPSSTGGSAESGTRGIVMQIRPGREAGEYLVELLAGEARSGERAWLRAIDLFAA